MEKLIISILLLGSLLDVQAALIPQKEAPLETAFHPDSRCKEDGVLPVLNDCTSYLECKNGEGRVRKCPDGYRFDFNLHCIPDEDGDCGVSNFEKDIAPEICPQIYSVNPFLEDCTKYIVCHEGRGEVKECPEGKVYKNDIGCVDGNDCALPVVVESEEICPQIYSVYPFLEDCTKYIVCHDGRGDVKQCPEGQVYNHGIGCVDGDECALPVRVESKDMLEPADVDICSLPPDRGPCAGSFLAYSFDRKTNSCSEFRYGGCFGNLNNFGDEESCLQSCINENEIHTDEFYCKENGTFADPHNCSRYLECFVTEDDVAFRTIQCPQGLHYSVETKQCEDKCTAKCDNNLEMCKPHPDFVCSEDGTYMYRGDCESYHECSWGTATKKKCYGGLHFSKETKRCELPCNAKCDPDLACECGWSSCKNSPDVKVNDSLLSFCSGDAILPVPSDCSKFIACSDGKGHYMNCPHGLHYSVRTLKCDTPCNAQCDPHIPCFMEQRLCDGGECFECPREEGDFSDLHDCSIYHKCKNGSSTIFSCPPGKLFDHRTARCLKKDKALCVYVCEKPNSIYKHPLDINSYILCQHGIPVVQKCPEGATFHEEERKCLETDLEVLVNNLFDFLQLEQDYWNDY